ncbi:MAG: DNA -binding domain-containing protein [Hyphomicrobiaceae bacterium]
MTARADRLGVAADADFCADVLHGLASIHIDAVGRQHVVVKSGSRRVTICIRGAAVAVAPARVTFEMTSLAGLFAAQRRVAALQQIFDDEPASDPTWTITGQEKRDALIALDALCNGASHRDVAILIFGSNKVDAEWSADGCDLKDYVRRCRNRGVRFMQGGYRRLLR